MRILLSRLRALFRRARLDEDLDADVRAHLDLLEAEYVSRGETPAAARLAARRAFGGVEQMKEIYRDRRAFGLVTDCVRDARFALRLLIKERWFAATAILVLSLGIAANNTVFVLTNGLLLRDLPFADPDRIVTIGTSVGGCEIVRTPASRISISRTGRRAAHVRWPGRNHRDDDERRGRGSPGALHRRVCLGERVQPHRPCTGHRPRLRRERRSSRRGAGRDPERRAVAHALQRRSCGDRPEPFASMACRPR